MQAGQDAANIALACPKNDAIQYMTGVISSE